MADYKKMAQQILNNIGGSGNVAEFNHCATRLRIHLKDGKQVKDSAVKNIDGVAGTVLAGNNYQVVIGTDVAQVYNAFSKIAANSSSSETVKTGPKQKFSWKKLGRTIIDFLSGTFVPILGVLCAAGLISAVLNIGTNLFGLSPKSGTYIVLNAVYEAGFFFLPVYVGFSAARRLQMDGFLGGMLGAFLVFKTIDQAKGLSFLGIAAPTIQYDSTVIPVILGVLFMKLIDMVLQRYVPKEVKFFVNPLVEMLITAPVVVLWLGPIGYEIGSVIVGGLSFLYQHLGWFSVGIMAAISPLLITTGTNQALLPLTVTLMSSIGCDPFVLPAMLANNIAVGSSALAVATYTHNLRTREVGVSAGITGVVGITEPAIFGVLINDRNAYLSTMFSAGMGGLLAGILRVKEYAIVSPGIGGLPAYVHATNGQMDSNFWCALAVVIFTAVLSYAATYFFGKRAQDRAEAAKDDHLYSPIDGTVEALAKVNDKVFSKGLVGDGVAIVPTNGAVYSPVAGKITMIAKTKHAIGLTMADGTEILVHLGLDTVDLKGLPFEVKVKQGQTVTKGQLLVDMNVEMIKEEKKDPVVVMTLTQPEKMLINKSFGEKKAGSAVGLIKTAPQN